MNSRAISALLALVAFIIVACASPLLFTTLKVSGSGFTGDCGTIFASSKTWTYSSPYNNDEPSDLSSLGAVTDAIGNYRAGLAAGSDSFDACKSAHSTRWIEIGVTGAVTLGVLGTAVLFGTGVIGGRRSIQP